MGGNDVDFGGVKPSKKIWGPPKEKPLVCVGFFLPKKPIFSGGGKTPFFPFSPFFFTLVVFRVSFWLKYNGDSGFLFSTPWAGGRGKPPKIWVGGMGGGVFFSF